MHDVTYTFWFLKDSGQQLEVIGGLIQKEQIKPMLVIRCFRFLKSKARKIIQSLVEQRERWLLRC